jgi:hypothetical protein
MEMKSHADKIESAVLETLKVFWRSYETSNLESGDDDLS